MAIKLADVIENIHTSYPLIETHRKSVIGLYNGRASTLQPIKIAYTGEAKTNLTEFGNPSSARIRLTTSYADVASTGFVTAATSDSLLVQPGGLIVAKDDEIRDHADNANVDYASIYLAQKVNPGDENFNDATRANIVFTSELVQQFDRYKEIPLIDLGGSANSLAEIVENNDDFYLAGYDKVNKRMRRFDLQSLVGLFGILLGEELIGGGVISATDAGGAGNEADVDGDGSVGVSDLLIFLNSFGNTNATGDNYVSKFRMLTGNGDQILMTPSAEPDLSGSGTDGAFNWSDLTTFNFPGAYSVNHAVYGWNNFASPLDASVQNYIELNDRAQSSNANLWFNNKNLRAVITAKVEGAFVDFIAFFIKVLVTTAGSQKREQVYFMRPEGAANASYFMYGQDNNSQPGAGHTQSWFYSSNSQQIEALDYEPTDTGVSTSAIMQSNTWDLSSTQSELIASGSSELKIEDIEVRFGVFSYLGTTDLVISRVHVYVDEELLYFIHPD